MTKEEVQLLTKVVDRAKSNTKRLDGFDNELNKLDNKIDIEVSKMNRKVENIYDLTLSVKEIATEMKAMREDMNKIDSRVLAIETKPSKRYEGIIDKIIYTILGIIIAYIFSKIGM